MTLGLAGYVGFALFRFRNRIRRQASASKHEGAEDAIYLLFSRAASPEQAGRPEEEQIHHLCLPAFQRRQDAAASEKILLGFVVW